LTSEQAETHSTGVYKGIYVKQTGSITFFLAAEIHPLLAKQAGVPNTVVHPYKTINSVSPSNMPHKK